MYKRKLCLSTNDTFGIPEWEQVSLFKKVGFEGFNVLWSDGEDEMVEKCAEAGKWENMIFQSIHAPWGMCNRFWKADCSSEHEDGVKTLTHCLDLCKKFDVKIMV